MESDTSDKKTSLEEMSKEDIVKKYNNLLAIAKKAKQSKDEALLELKKTKGKEVELLSTVDALQDVIESFTEKQKQFAEFDNRVKQTEEKNTNLKMSLQKLEDQYSLKIIECSRLDETLRNMSEKLSTLEEKYSETLEKLQDIKENYAKVDTENKLYKEKIQNYEKSDTSDRFKEILGENEKLTEKLKKKETEVNDLTKKCTELGEKLKNAISEKKEFKKSVEEAEQCKLELSQNGNELKKEFDEKSKECVKLLDKLLKEEKENFKLMEEISELKGKEKENEKKFIALREERDRIKEQLETQLKSLKDDLEKQLIDKERLRSHVENLEEDIRLGKMSCEGEISSKFVSELEESMKRENNLEIEKDNLNKAIEQLKKERDDEKMQHGMTKTEKEKIEKELFNLSSEISNKTQEWESLLKKEQNQFEMKEKQLRLELNNSKKALEKYENESNRQSLEKEKEIEEMKKNYEGLIGVVQKKLVEVLHVFGTVKELRNTFETELKNKLKGFQIEQSEMRQKIEEVVLRFAGQLCNGNLELLSEMNVMNQVLKERGESISKLEQVTENQRKELDEALAKINNQSVKLQEKNKKLEEMEEEITMAKQEAETKHQAMREMEEEMWRMKNNEHGEALSSSTLSRAEESSRLMELEESFEERYSKLKVVAVKLKKKVTELQKQVEAERSRLITAEAEYQNKVTGFQNQVKSLRNIQTEYDALQDELDEERKKKNALEKKFELAQKELISVKHELEEIRSDKEQYKSDKSSFEKIKKELTAHIGELKQTVEKQKSECNQLEKQAEEMRNQLAIKDRHLEEEKEKHTVAMQLLEEQKQDSKKHSVLELEMAAYEKTAEDLKKRLDNKEKQVKELENNLESERKVRESKEKEIAQLKATIVDEQLKAEGFCRQLNQFGEELNNQRLEMQKKIETIKSLEKSKEEKNLKNETLSLELESVIKEKFKLEEKCRNNEEKLCRQIHSLEEKIMSTQDCLNQREMELDELKKEFQAYKVRAQSVLRQSQKEMNPSRQQNALEELEQLKSTTESLKIRLEESNRKLQKLMEENGTFLEEKKKLFGRVQELNSSVSELRDENQILKETRQKENEEHAEALRMQKLQTETLVQCFQRQIEDLEAKNAIQIEELKKEQELKESKAFLIPEVKRTDEKDILNNRKISGTFKPVKPEKEILDVMLLEREECEGSESVDSTSPQTGNNPIPLEQLLNEPEPPRKTSQDVGHLKNLLEKSENRIKHLTLLLAEAESDSARLNQLNEVLKEEIRRHQRSLEREKHAQNFEYLKNVILKFVSLQNVDEKLRLVPVLNTILKLSPNEELMLTNSAKGIFETGSKGWSNYLSIWPGG